MVRVQRGINVFAKLLFNAGVLGCGEQDTRAGHENLIVLLMAETICLQCFEGGAVDIAAIEMEISGVDDDRAETAGVAVEGINLARSLQLEHRLLAKLLISGAQGCRAIG